MNKNAIDIRALIDRRPIGRYQWLIVVLGFLVIALDGFDAAVMGFIAPELTREWGIAKVNLGPLMSASLVGMVPGAMIAGPVADRIGRKSIMVVAVGIFGASTLMGAFAANITWLVLLRLLAGIGLGATVPITITLVSEYAPERKRSLLANIVFCGFMIGASGGGMTAAAMITGFGWRGVLVVGGLLPLAIVPVLWWKMPESAQFLTVRGAPSSRIRRVVELVAPGSTDEYSTFRTMKSDVKAANTIGVILSSQLRFGTLMLWISYAMGLFISFMLGNWLPTLFRDEGFSVQQAALLTSIYQLGGAVGTLILGWIIDRWNPHRVLPLSFILGGILLVAVSTKPESLPFLGLLTCAVGLCLPSAAIALNPVAVSFYPTEARATGASWMHGMGRLGGIMSAFIGAQMLGAGWTFSEVLIALTIPVAIAAIAIFFKGLSQTPRPARNSVRPSQ